MVEQAHEISPKAGPNEVESHTLPNVNMRAAQLIGRQLAQIGDELNSRWSEKLYNQWPRRQRWQAFANIDVLNLGTINGWITGRLWWSKVMPMVKASWVVPQLHTQACQAAMKCFSWVYNFSDWSWRSKCFLASAVLLVAAAAWKISKS